MSFPRLGIPAALAVVALLTACGSTVEMSSQPAGSGAVDPGLGTPGVREPRPVPSTQVGGAGPGVVAPTRGPGAVTSTPGSVARVASVVPEKGRGWDRTTVSVGVITNSDIQQVATTLG